MEKDKNSKYWGYMEQNEAVKDAIQPDIGVGKEIILLIYEHNVSQCSWSHEDWSSSLLELSSFSSVVSLRLARRKIGSPYS